MEKVDGVLTYVDYDDIDLLEDDPDEFWEDVKEIGANAFCDTTHLKEIEIPSKITVIGEEAFLGCKELKKVVVHAGVQLIEESAFEECTSLEEIEISAVVIRDLAFYGCKKLNKIVLHEGIEEIEPRAFYGCKSLKEVNFPSTLTSIPQSMFYEFENLEKVVLPKNLKFLSTSSFFGCSSLKEIEIPGSVEEISTLAFRKCDKLSKVKLNEGIAVIGKEAFSECHSLEEIEIPHSVGMISSQAFYKCKNLKKVILHDGLKTIHSNAFSGCKNLEEIELPANMHQIDPQTFDYERFKYVNILKNGRILLSNSNSRDDIVECVSTSDIYKAYPNIDLGIFIVESEKTKKLIENVKNNIDKGISVSGNIFTSYETFEKLANKNFKLMKNLIKLIPTYYIDDQVIELYKLAYNMGVLEDRSVTVKVDGKDIPVCDVAYTVLQGAIIKKEINVNEFHSRFQSMKMSGYNEEFLKFMADKTNLSELKQEENVQEGFTTKVYEWFEERKGLKIDAQLDNVNNIFPLEEDNRYKIKTYEESENGIDKVKWKKPTVSLFKKEFAGRKFVGITSENEHIAQHLGQFHLYEQKHFDKAVEINEERKKRNVIDSLTKEKVKEDLVDSLEDYQKRTKELMDNIVETICETSKNQTDTMSKIFTYEMLEKSDVANFSIGFLTSCCATLYGAGAGAQRAMILHPDMQPLVIRNSKGEIVCFGIVYVNRNEGYAVINDFEVNKKYQKNEEVVEEIYNKAMQGVKSFVEEYNKENHNKPINIVTCGVSPNWDALNNYIKGNPKSMILNAPNFDEFKYVGSGSWSGDWHREQYVIWKRNKEGTINKFQNQKH